MDTTDTSSTAQRAASSDSQVASLWACQIITFAAATICFILRMFSRRLTRVQLWWDDWFTIAAQIVAIVWIILVCLWMNNGLGRHIYEWHEMSGQSVDDALYMNKLLLYIAELFYAFGLFFGKVAVLSFYWRMFSVTNIKLPIQILGGCAVVWIIIRTFMGIWHCVPIRAFWDASAGGYCAIDDSKFFAGTIIVHVVMDVAILSLPIIQIQKLRLPTMQKLGVMSMFMFGIFICAAGIVIVVESRQFDAASVDLTYNLSPIVLWATVEVNMVVVSSSMPVLRPALKYVTTLGRLPSSLNNSTGHATNSQSYALSNVQKSHRRRSMTKSRADDGGDSGSTYPINDHNSGEFDFHAVDGPHKTKVTIQGRDRDMDASSSDLEAGDGGGANLRGIQVRSETTVTSVRYSK